MPKQPKPYLEPALKAAMSGGKIFPDWLRQKIEQDIVKPNTVMALPRGSGKTAAATGTYLYGAINTGGPIPTPASPFPYGTVIRPIGAGAPGDRRHMVVGVLGNMLHTINLNGEGDLLMHEHPLETLLEYWEEVPS